MATSFASRVTVIAASWLNSVASLVEDVFASATTPAQARTAISVDSSAEVTAKDDAIYDDLASTDSGKGAELVGQQTLYAYESPQTVSDRLNGQPVSLLRFINPAYHSGIRDGTDTHDLSERINYAFQECPHVFIPQGQFHIDAPLLGKSGLTVTGAGYHSIIRTTQTVMKMINLYDIGSAGASSIDDVSLSNFRLYGGCTTGFDAGSGGGRNHCVNIENFKNFKTHRLWLQNVNGDGLYMRTADGADVGHLFCKDTYRQGVSFTKGFGVTIKTIRGAGTISYLVDIEPNTGDTIYDLNIDDISTLSSTIKPLNFYNSVADYDIISKVSVSRIRGKGNIVFRSLTDAKIWDVSMEAVAGVEDTVTFYLCKDTIAGGLNIGGTHINERKLVVSSCDGLTVYGGNIKGAYRSGSGTEVDIDILSSNNTVLNDVNVVEGGVAAARIRNSTITRLKNFSANDATYGVLLAPTTSNDDIRLEGIATPNCGTGADLSGVNGDVYIDGDLSGATTPIDIHGTFDGNLVYGNGLKGVRREVQNYTSAPSAGSWNKGDIAWNASPDATEYAGWVCVTAGTPGTWKGFGTIQS